MNRTQLSVHDLLHSYICRAYSVPSCGRGSLAAEKASPPHLHIFLLTKPCDLPLSTSYAVLHSNRVRDTSPVAPASIALSKARPPLPPSRPRSQAHRRRCCAPAREQRDARWAPRETAGDQDPRHTPRRRQACRCYWKGATANCPFPQGRHLSYLRAYVGRICQIDTAPCYSSAYAMP